MVLELTEDLKTGVEEMDKDHQMLVDYLNEVYTLLKEGKKEQAIRIFKEELLHYVNWHLTREEKFMEAIGYPEFERHKKAHDMFKKVILDLLPKVGSGDVEAFRESLALSWGWLAGHIGKVDKKYGEYAREKGLI
ncbi:bacteriohemerythrin [Hydrogenobacter sp. T-2]|uniref:bacteriohemerythrin n=1 Tax=Pampinifervens diazotrophicum TaxID=1632018 RepID=UPI002B259B7D|nr:bacteriohemerythrin [Hydrogenobacter sp. T-2]WPM31843.1 bacteriohemerythrin [Hydrogenobacter sp. T-2]